MESAPKMYRLIGTVLMCLLFGCLTYTLTHILFGK